MWREAMDALGTMRPALSVLVAAQSGDPVATLAALDLLEEEGVDLCGPYEVDKKYLICTVTLYYVGEVAEVGFGWLRLRNASWVHWTGRLSTLLRVQAFAHKAFGHRSPRTEYVDDAIVERHAIVSAYPWTGELPKGPVE